MRREHPGNEGREAAGVFLDAPDAFQMIDAVTPLFAAAEHHRGRGAQAKRMGHAVHLLPVVAGAL